MKNSNSSLIENVKSVFAASVIVIEIAIAFVFYYKVLGSPTNFVGNDPANHPLTGNYFGIVYKGGVLVPMLIALLMMVITFGIERVLTIGSAKGRGSIRKFVSKIRSLLATNNIDQAIAECDRQR